MGTFRKSIPTVSYTTSLDSETGFLKALFVSFGNCKSCTVTNISLPQGKQNSCYLYACAVEKHNKSQISPHNNHHLLFSLHCHSEEPRTALAYQFQLISAILKNNNSGNMNQGWIIYDWLYSCVICQQNNNE